MLIPPKGGPVPHSHATFQEAFYIIDGGIKVITIAIKGSYVSLNSLERKNEVSIIVGPLTGQSDWRGAYGCYSNRPRSKRFRCNRFSTKKVKF
jgi:hypothetical protein